MKQKELFIIHMILMIGNVKTLGAWTLQGDFESKDFSPEQ